MIRKDHSLNGRINRAVKKHIPIYTNVFPDPATGRPDCNFSKSIKEQARAAMMLRIVNNIKKFDAGYV